MKTGFIGLGAMGMHMARNLAKANLLETVFNRTISKTKPLKKEFTFYRFFSLKEKISN